MDVGVNTAKAGARVWDGPVRLVHWSIAMLVLVAWLTREARHLDVHAAAGYALLGLAAFRIAWGFVGSAHARFRNFAYSPRAALAYLRELARGSPPHYTGHNPAGSWSVYGLLVFEIAVTLTGLIAIAGMHGMGPLSGHVDHAAADAALAWHEGIAWAMLVLVAAHLAGVAASSLVHRENLVAAMFSGRKPGNEGASVSSHAGVAACIAIAVIAGGVAYLVHAARQSDLAAPGPAAIAAIWQRECDSCHLPYAPCMLPLASWTRMLRENAEHFGEDLALSDEALARLAAVARTPLPDEPWTCWKTRASVPAGAAPLEISVTPYWRRAHAALAPAQLKNQRVAGAHDCGACHRDAQSSIFHPRMIQMPQ